MNIRLVPVLIIIGKVLKFMFWDTKDVQAATLDDYYKQNPELKPKNYK